MLVSKLTIRRKVLATDGLEIITLEMRFTT